MTRPVARRRKLLSPLLVFLFALPFPLRAQDDAFIEGYATAILDREFGISDATVEAHDGVLVLRARGLTGRTREKVIAALSRIKGVKEVRVEEAPPPPGAPRRLTGDGWQALPEGRAFPILVADPRSSNFSVAYQHYVRSGAPDLQNVAALSLGEDFGLVRYQDPDFGRMSFSVEPAIFGLFNLDDLSHDLVNADYRIGLPVEYGKGPLSLKLSVFHQSSHLGDGYPSFLTHYLSYEAVDLKAALSLGDVLLYAGASRMVDRDPADLALWSVQEGAQWISSGTILGDALAPLFAIDVQEHEQNFWRPSVSVRAGLEWVNPEQPRRRLQFLLEFYRGYNPNGQYYNERANWWGLGLHVYF